MLLNDSQIKDYVTITGMIDPFIDQQVNHDEVTGKKLISFGLSSFGYDVRLSDEFRVPVGNYENVIVDPKDFNPDLMKEVKLPQIIIPSHSFILGRSFEWISVPRNISVLCVGKSTYARTGILLNTTPLESRWSGHITLEISNTNVYPVVVYAYEGIAQLLFFEGLDCEVSYADRNGKYQNQVGVTYAK